MITPVNETVLIKPLEREVKTSKGIILGNTQSMEEGLKLGEIIHGGESPFKKGQNVFYSAYSAVWVSDAEGDSYHMLSQYDIMGIEE